MDVTSRIERALNEAIGQAELPGCPPRPEQLMDAIMKLHTKVQDIKMGANRQAEVTELERQALVATPSVEMKGLLR